MKNLILYLSLIFIAGIFAGSLQAESDILNVNFYHYGKPGSLTTEEQARLRVEGTEAAGVGDWNSTGWNNIYAGTGTYTITNSGGSSAICAVTKTRNASPYWWTKPRVTLLTIPNADLMDSGYSATEDNGLIFEMTVSDIPYSYYDVIIYLRVNSGQYTPGSGKLVFNGGPVQSFTFPGNSEFSAFDEVTADGDTGNYVVYKGVTGSSFTFQMWGDNFCHMGPAGFQFGVLDMGAPVVDAGSDWITWSGEAVTLDDVTVVNNDPGAGEVDLSWSAEPVTGLDVLFSDATAQYPTITITKTSAADDATPVILTLTANQAGKEPVTSMMTIDVYDDACKASIGAGTAVIGKTDFDSNCVTDFEDVAEMAMAWLVDFSLTGPVDK